MKHKTILFLGFVLISILFFSCKNQGVNENKKQNAAYYNTEIKNPAGSEYHTILNPAFNKVEDLINISINERAFPGAVLLVWKDGKIIFEKPFGHFIYNDSSAKVQTNTIYDLASLTKVIATTTAAMICVDRKLFNLNDPVAAYIPLFAENGKGKITIKNLLLHNSGLPGYKKFYFLYNKAEDVLNDIYSSKTIYSPGTKTVYSDLGMIVLGKVIEKVAGKGLDAFCFENIFKPLQMNDTYFNPPASLKDRIAPTEIDDYWRNRLLIGEVHDETSSLLRGVAGHAGLFSTANDISKVLQMLLRNGIYEGKQIVDSSTVKLFTSKQSDERALGWDIKNAAGSSAGNLFSDKSYGHTGFTGTSVWTDPTRNLFVIFLTNRVYPSRENNKIIKIRPKLHELIIRAIKNINN